MTSYNRVILTGRVTNPPKRRYRPDGLPVIQFPLELNDSDDSSGETLNQRGKGRPLHPEGPGQAGRSVIDIVAIGKLAEVKFDLVQSGQRLLVVGRLNQRRWQTPEGKKQTQTEVIATDLRKIDETDREIDLIERGAKDEETF